MGHRYAQMHLVKIIYKVVSKVKKKIIFRYFVFPADDMKEGPKTFLCQIIYHGNGLLMYILKIHIYFLYVYLEIFVKSEKNNMNFVVPVERFKREILSQMNK